MKLIAVFLLILFNSHSAGAQRSAFSAFWKLSGPEKWWVFTHPFVAKKAFIVTAEARQKSDSLLKISALDNDPLGGQIDAFRHTYWMARMAQSMRWKKALRLGVAHEKANRISFTKNQTDEEGVLPDSVSSAMDIYNNEIGVSIGCNFKFLPPSEIYTIVLEKITSGKLKVIYKNANGIELDCNGNVIDLRKYKGNWNIPKCLMNSDYLFKR